MTEGLLAAAQARTQRCKQSVLDTIRTMEREGERITLKGAAARAGVSRNFIYTTPEVEAALRAASERQGPLSVAPRIAATPSSDASLRTRLVAAIEENRRLRDELDTLKATNERLVSEIVTLQNPAPKNVAQLRRRRG